MSKYFNKEILRGLERVSNRRRDKPEQKPEVELPNGNPILLFVSNDPQAEISRAVIRSTVKKVCCDLNAGQPCLVRIEGKTREQDDSDSDKEEQSKDVVQQISPRLADNVQRGSGDHSINYRQSINEPQSMALDRKPQNLLAKQFDADEAFSFSDLFDSDSDTDADSGSELAVETSATNNGNFRLRLQLFESFTCLGPTVIMHKVRDFARFLVRVTFGRTAPLVCRNEENLSPTLFGPSPDEPLTALIDHIYNFFCWLFEPENTRDTQRANLDTKQLQNALK